MTDMSDTDHLIPGAKQLVHVNGRVQAGERVLVVTDPTMERYATPVADVAREIAST